MKNTKNRTAMRPLFPGSRGSYFSNPLSYKALGRLQIDNMQST